jgi:hypothetical protein
MLMPLLAMAVDGSHQGKRKHNHGFAGHRIVAVATMDTFGVAIHSTGKIQRSSLAGMRIHT